MSPAKKHIGAHQNVLYRLVDPRELTLNPENERDYIADNASMEALRQSIRSEGIKTPLHIYDDGTVDDGNRRLFNIQLLLEEGVEIESVPAIIVPRPDNEVEAVLSRLNKNEAAQFSALEQGRAFAKLRDAGLNNTQISNRTPFTAMHVGNMLTLHDTSDTVRDAVRASQVSATLAVETVRKHGEEVLLQAVDLAVQQGKEKATQRHVDAVAAAIEAANAVGPKQASDAEPVEAEVEAEVEALDPDDVPFDGGVTVSDAEPTDPVIDAEEEVLPPADATPMPAAKTTVSAKALAAIIAPTLLNLIEVMENGSRAEKLEAFDLAQDDFSAFLATARRAGLID